MNPRSRNDRIEATRVFVCPRCQGKEKVVTGLPFIERCAVCGWAAGLSA